MNKEFNKKNETVYCVKVTDTQTERKEKLSKLFDREFSIWYLGPNDQKTDQVIYARFWKDKNSATRAGKFISGYGKYKDVKPEILEFTLEEFINMIPDQQQDSNYVQLRNKRLKEESIEYLNEKKQHLAKYKAIDAYKIPDKWITWSKCPKCDLRPLVWQFNNGSQTACGCGENEYKHFSIHSESILSHVSRNNGSALHYDNDGLKKNWNHWCRTGEIIFDREKEIEMGKW